MANLKPEEYLKLQYPNNTDWVLIRSVRIDSPKSTLKKDVQVFMWLLKVGKKEAAIMTFMTNSYEADLVTYKKENANSWFIVLGYAMTYDMGKSEMENLLSDSKAQLDMLNKRLPHIQEGADVIRGVTGWVITQDPWDPNVVPPSLKPPNTEPAPTTTTMVDSSGPTASQVDPPTSVIDNGSPSAPIVATNPTSITGKINLKVKSGPGVIIGITDVDILDGKADFSGIQFDQAGDYVISVTSTSSEIEPTELKFKVLPEPEVIPQDSKGATESNASGTRPIIAQIDPPTISLPPMKFSTQGASQNDSIQVATTIGNLPFFNYNGVVINDRDIQQLRLYHEGILPKVKIIFRDSNNVISQNPPKDDTKFEIFIKSGSHNLKPIHLKFKVEDYQKLQNNLYTVTGAIDISDIYRMKFNVYRGTSFNAIREICKDLKLGFNSNIENTNDDMPWRNIGDRPYKFIGDIIKHSYISDESFMAGYIDFYYCFNYVDVEKEMKRNVSGDVGIDTGGFENPDTKDTDKITRMRLMTEKGLQSSSFYFIKTGQKSDSTKISMQQGYKTRTKFYDKVKKMFLVFDVDSTTTDGSKSIILKGIEDDKESFDNNYVTKYSGKIDTDNVHKNHNYAVTQNRINLDNMMKNQMDIKLPNPNFNIYKYQKIDVSLVKEAATLGSEEIVEWRYSGEWLISEIAYDYSNGKLSQEVKLVRKEMGKNPDEIKDTANNPQVKPETKDQKNENPIIGTASETITNKPNLVYKVDEEYTVQDTNGKKYIITIKKLSENGTDVVAELKDIDYVLKQTVTNPDSISGVTQSIVESTPPIASTASSIGIYRHEVKLELSWGTEDGESWQSKVTEITKNYEYVKQNGSWQTGSFVGDGTGTLITKDENLKDSKSIFIAIQKDVPIYKPEDWQKSLTPLNWTLFELTDYGINDFYENDLVIPSYSPKLYDSLKYRILQGEERHGHLDENGKRIVGFDAWHVPTGSIKIIDESGKVVEEGNAGSAINRNSLIKGGFVGSPPKYEYNRWFSSYDLSGTASIPVSTDQEYTQVGGENTIHIDMRGFPQGVYTLEIKYYVPLYEKINSDGENVGKPYNGTGLWETKKQRLMTKDANGYNPHEVKILKGTFTIVKKSKKR